MEILSKIALTISSTFFLILLIVSYFNKKGAKSKLRSDIFGYLLVMDLILLTFEIVTVCLFEYTSSEELSYFFLRAKFFFDMIYFTLLFYYYLSFDKEAQYRDITDLIKRDKESMYFAIFAAICSVIYLFLPFSSMTGKTFTFMPGIAYYFVAVYGIIMIVSSLIILFLNKEQKNKRVIVSVIYLVLIMCLFMIFQVFNPTISILGLSGVVHLFSVYSITENPDLEYIEEIAELTDEIERASKTKSDFLSNMSHEIRTPMNAIVGFSETVLNDSYFDKNRAYNDIKHIETSGKNLLEIINNILDISKIESGKETLEEKEYSIAKIIMELASIIQTRIDDKNIKLEVLLDKTVSSRLYGDSTKLFQILLNILTNSVKYTEVGRIRLEMTHQSNGVYETLKFKIADTGFGIKKEDYDKLFEKFARLDMAKNNEIEGTGLGLVITKRYVDLMGGTINFESEYGVGTTFYVEIPQKIVDRTEVGVYREVSTTSKLSEAMDCSKYKIMIVDDNKLNLKVAERILSAYKFQIDTATSGKECVYKYKEGNHYDMMFVDHMMSEMDGLEVLHIVKKLEGYDTPIMVVLTANAIAGARERYLIEGFDEYLSKPIDIAELNKIIHKYFENRVEPPKTNINENPNLTEFKVVEEEIL